MKDFFINFIAAIKDPHNNIYFTEKQAKGMVIVGTILAIPMLVYAIWDLAHHIWVAICLLVILASLMCAYFYANNEQVIREYFFRANTLLKAIRSHFSKEKLTSSLFPSQVFEGIQYCLNKAYDLSPSLSIFQNIQTEKFQIIGTDKYRHEIVTDTDFIVTSPPPTYRFKTFRYSIFSIPPDVIDSERRLLQAIINQTIAHGEFFSLSSAMCGKIPTIYLKSIRQDGYCLIYDFVYVYSEKISTQIQSTITTVSTRPSLTPQQSTSGVPILLDAEFYALKTNRPVYIDLSVHAHLLICGMTGSGKTYAIFVILYLVAKHQKNTRIVICDYKKSGFAAFDGLSGFYGYTDVYDGITTVYKEFPARLQANDSDRNNQSQILLVDEYSAFISSLDKKMSEEAKRMIGEMLAMGRSLGIHVIVGLQRADAQHFQTGARDQFGAILMLGNISREQKQMLASDYKDEITAVNGRGEGYLLLDGIGLTRIKVPTAKNFATIEKTLKQSLGLHNYLPPDAQAEP